MPVTTRQYLLESFIDGDSYLAVADKRRFSTIDNQINRIAEIIGDGRIDGWDIRESVFPNIIVTSGNGLVNKFYVNTFGESVFLLSENSKFYIYAQRKVGIIGLQGPKSNIVSIAYADSGPPTTPSNFQVILGSDLGYSFTIEMSWTSNTENDLANYSILRSQDGDNFDVIGTATKDFHVFQDTVQENSLYYYQLYAVDLSGNQSLLPATYSISVPLSGILPQNPFAIESPGSEAAINVLWRRPQATPFDTISHWMISWVEMNTDGTTNETTRMDKIINRALYNERLDDLTTGQPYQISLYTVDVQNRHSTGFIASITPQPSEAPRDPQGIAYDMIQSSSGVQVNLSWTDGDSPYDPATTFRYKIYTTIDGQQESLPTDVPIGFTNEQISLYTFDLINYQPIPENTLVTFRITAVSQSGHESFGNYIRLVTAVFTAPLRLTNLSSKFIVENRSIQITWDNQKDTNNVRLQVIQAESDEYASDITIIDELIGKLEIYVLNNISIDATYTIKLTPINIENTFGPTSTIVQLTFIAGGLPLPVMPSNVDVKTNDREITLTWRASENSYTNYYNIYTKTGELTLNFRDWSFLEKVPKHSLSFTHYGLENNTLYSYYITSTDVYERESPHLSTNNVNLNYAQGTPKSSGIITEPTDVQLNLISGYIVVTWNSLPEEYNGFTIYRSVNNLYSWTQIATVDRDTFIYQDVQLPLIDGTIFYYLIDKTINDAQIVIQTTDIAPDHAIFLGTVETSDFDNSSYVIDAKKRRDIKNLLDPLTESTTRLLLPHQHNELTTHSPTRINLSSSLKITDWISVDDKTYTTTADDINGSSFVLRINNKIPNIFFTIDPIIKRITFAESIVINNIVPDIELEIFGIEEVHGVLDDSRFNHLHARQVKFGTIRKEQLIQINHEGRIKERLFPERFLLERFNNHTFIVPQNNRDTTKNFGDGTTFYSVVESDGDITEIIDWDTFNDNALVGFNVPSYSDTTLEHINNTVDVAKVSSNPGGYQSTKSYIFQFEFIDNDPTRWVRITSADTTFKSNPVIELNKRIRFKILASGSIFLTLGIREISATNLPAGSNGGQTGPIEWVGITNTITNSQGQLTPVGIKILGGDEWQDVDIDLRKAAVAAFPVGGGNGAINKSGLGVLEHLAFTIDPDSSNPVGPFTILIDKLEQVDDLLAAGTSQGILVSEDFGSSWQISRLTDTPVHKFYKATNNEFLWAISATELLLSADPVAWFAVQGTTGIEFIKDIIDDSSGNIFISSEKGVYWLEIDIIRNFSTLRQTQPINAFTTDAYALYYNDLDNEIWVSTEIGIFKTQDKGITWHNTGMTTAGLVCYQILNIGGHENPVIIAITRKHVLRKMPTDQQFQIVADLEEQYHITDIWKCEFFDHRLYVSTSIGVFVNELDILLTPGIYNISFIKILDGLNIRGITRVVFGLDTIHVEDGGVKLYIGLENELVQMDTNNRLSTKVVYSNKELPSFFINDNEITSGYIYNTFNGVVSFREPILANTMISAARIPRRDFFAQNGGWAQTNPNALIFIYKNGLPAWLDFEINQNTLLLEVQSLKGQLQSTSELTTFNSLYPESTDLLQSVIDDIDSIQTGGIGGIVNITNETIIKLLDDYTQFLSNIEDDYINNNKLSMIRVLQTGIAKIQRKPGSKSADFEDMDGFIADDSTGITIDTVIGEVSFLDAFSNRTDLSEKQKVSFNKFDNLSITIFQSNLKNVGEFSHREIEDSMELVNSGLSSNMSRSCQTNLIKSGILINRQHQFLYDRYSVSNVQSQFFIANTNNWYDIVNSTIDYIPISSTTVLPQARFSSVVFSDPYMLNDFWIGTDVGISKFTIIDDMASLESFIQPKNTVSIQDIWADDNSIYVVGTDSDNQSIISVSHDFGETWINESTINLPSRINQFRIINGTKLVTTQSGMFYSDNNIGTWTPCRLSLSDNLASDSSSKTDFMSNIINIDQSTFIIIEVNRWFYTSGNGQDFFAVAGQIDNNNIKLINKILRYKNLTWIATDRGLYNDGNSILSDSVDWGLQIIENNLTESVSIHINDIASTSDSLYICASNHKIYRLTLVDNVMKWSNYKIPDFGSIHKIFIIHEQTLAAISYNKLRLVDISPNTGVFQ